VRLTSDIENALSKPPSPPYALAALRCRRLGPSIGNVNVCSGLVLRLSRYVPREQSRSLRGYRRDLGRVLKGAGFSHPHRLVLVSAHLQSTLQESHGEAAASAGQNINLSTPS